jgi:hypothetical protein
MKVVGTISLDTYIPIKLYRRDYSIYTTLSAVYRIDTPRVSIYHHQNGRHRYGAIRPNYKTRRESRPSSHHSTFGSPWRDRAIPIEPDLQSTVGLTIVVELTEGMSW